MSTRYVVSTGGNDDLLCFNLSFAGNQAIAMAIRRQSLYGNALSHITCHMPGKALKEAHDCVFVHESLRLFAVVRKVGQTALPVGRDQAEGIPALLIPGVADAVFLEHQRTDAVLLQGVGHRQSSLSSANDNNLVGLSGGCTFHCAVRLQSAHNFVPQPSRKFRFSDVVIVTKTDAISWDSMLDLVASGTFFEQ